MPNVEKMQTILDAFNEAFETHPEVVYHRFSGLMEKPYMAEEDNKRDIENYVRPSFFFQCKTSYGVKLNDIMDHVDNAMLYFFARYNPYECGVVFEVPLQND